MADPHQGLEGLEWIKVIGSAMAAAVGSVWGWVKATKRSIYASIDRAEHSMNQAMDRMQHTQQEHQTKIAVLEVQQINSLRQLQSIHEDTQNISEKIDQLMIVVMNRK